MKRERQFQGQYIWLVWRAVDLHNYYDSKKQTKFNKDAIQTCILTINYVTIKYFNFKYSVEMSQRRNFVSTEMVLGL